MRELVGYREAVEQGRPEDVYEDLHKGPVFDPELRVVIVGSYGAARQVLDNKNKAFTNAKTLMPVYKPEPDVMETLGEIFQTYGRGGTGVAFLDGEVHRERRRMARTATNVVHYGDDEITKAIDEALDQLDEKRAGTDGRVDIVGDFIEPLTSRTALQQRTGVPEDLTANLAALLQGQVDLVWGVPAPERQRRLVQDMKEVWRITMEAVERNRAAMRTGQFTHNIITGFLSTRPDLIADDYHDIYGHVNAGYTSLAHTLSNIVVYGLMEQPGVWRELHDAPGRVPDHLQTILRRHSGVHGWFKTVADGDGVELDGEHVAGGTRLIVGLNAANQAPDRGDTDPTIMFSHGAHTCLGKDYSTRFFTNTLMALTQRYPDAHVPGEPRHWANLAFNGFPEAAVVLL